MKNERRELLKNMGLGVSAIVGATAVLGGSAVAKPRLKNQPRIRLNPAAKRIVRPMPVGPGPRPMRPGQRAAFIKKYKGLRLAKLNPIQKGQLGLGPNGAGRLSGRTRIGDMLVSGGRGLSRNAANLTKMDLENLGAGRIIGKVAGLSVADIGTIQAEFAKPGAMKDIGTVSAVSCCCCTPCCCAAAVEPVKS